MQQQALVARAYLNLVLGLVLLANVVLYTLNGAFIDVKTNRYETGNSQREQSNNSLIFMQKPSKETIRNLLHRILHTGDPGFVNGVEAKRRAPEMEGLNPCAEILLPNAGFCNLMLAVWHLVESSLHRVACSDPLTVRELLDGIFELTTRLRVGFAGFVIDADREGRGLVVAEAHELQLLTGQSG
jgi:hypothetical protein